MVKTLESLKYFENIIRNIKLIICSALMLATFTVNAKDFGTKGHTHQILEQPFLQMIDERLQKVDIEAERKKMEKITRDRIENPPALKHIIPADEGRVFYYDPTYTLEKDVILPCGKLMYEAGTTINPLEEMDLDRRLFFIDARDERQIAWLQSKIKPIQDEFEVIKDKIILVAGSPLKLGDKLGRDIYFDQQGTLTKQFGIEHSPALVEQEGLWLRIEEFKLTKNR